VPQDQKGEERARRGPAAGQRAPRTAAPAELNASGARAKPRSSGLLPSLSLLKAGLFARIEDDAGVDLRKASESNLFEAGADGLCVPHERPVVPKVHPGPKSCTAGRPRRPPCWPAMRTGCSRLSSIMARTRTRRQRLRYRESG